MKEIEKKDTREVGGGFRLPDEFDPTDPPKDPLIGPDPVAPEPGCIPLEYPNR